MDSSGVITSPNFDSSNSSARYGANDECMWTISNPASDEPSTVYLQITYLETEQVLPQILNSMQDICRSDFIEVRSGLTSADPLVQTFCGRMADLLNTSLAIPGPVAYIRWRTDYSLQMKGFRLQYSIFRKISLYTSQHLTKCHLVQSKLKIRCSLWRNTKRHQWCIHQLVAGFH